MWEMLRRSEEGIEEDVGVLRSGNGFQLSGVKMTVTTREGEYNSAKGSDYGSVLPDDAEFWESVTTTSQYQSDEDSLQAKYCVDPAIPGSNQNS